MDRVSVSVVSTTAHALALSYDILRKLEAAMKKKWKLSKIVDFCLTKIGLNFGNNLEHCIVYVGTYIFLDNFVVFLHESRLPAYSTFLFHM